MAQVWEWAARGAASYEEMTNLPAGLRGALDRARAVLVARARAEARVRDGTLKVLFDTADGHPVEAVLMRYRDGRRSVCVSSQSGCPLTCTFCATGQMRFGRNLTAGEILDQALHFRRIEPIDHAVFMGMGEPMLNLDAVLAAGAAAARPRGHAPPHDDLDRRLAARARPLRRRGEKPIRLALSLHAPTTALRSQLMPVNDRYPLAEVLAECRRYVGLSAGARSSSST